AHGVAGSGGDLAGRRAGGEDGGEDECQTLFHRALLSKIKRSRSTARLPPPSRPAARSRTPVRTRASGVVVVLRDPGVRGASVGVISWPPTRTRTLPATTSGASTTISEASFVPGPNSVFPAAGAT